MYTLNALFINDIKSQMWGVMQWDISDMLFVYVSNLIII